MPWPSWQGRTFAYLYEKVWPASSLTPEWFSWAYGDEVEESIRRVFTKEHFPSKSDAELEARQLKWASLLRRFQKYGHYSTGNRVCVLEGGDACYSEMLRCIEGASVRVWCESYIFDGSHVGEHFYRTLLAAARRGCDVVLQIDYIGAFGIPRTWVQELQQAGAAVSFFNPVLPSSASVGPISFRDHRKIMVVDEQGFCGGMNIQNEVGEAKYGSSRFYDVHAKLEGPCVADLAEVFRDTLQENGGRIMREPIPVPARQDPGVYVQILQSNVRRRRRTLQKVLKQSIEAADDSIAITTAYFFPPGFLRRALLQVPSRGASLSLLLSGSSDFYPLPGDLLAQTHFLRRFLTATQSYQERVAVHLYDKRHMHAKHMSVDGVFSYIGSFNYDLYSARRNLEVGVTVFDPAFAEALRSLHAGRLAEARRTELSDWQYHHPVVKVTCALAYGAIRLSGRNLFDGLDCFQRKWLVRKAALTYLLEEQAAQFVAMSMMWGLD